jgi:hypothetical protein
MAVTWKWYKARTRLNLDVWLKTNHVKNHVDFVSVLHTLGVIPPPAEEMKKILDEGNTVEARAKAATDQKQWGIVSEPNLQTPVSTQPEPKPHVESKPEPEITPAPLSTAGDTPDDKPKVNKWGIVEKPKRVKKLNKSKK